MLIYHTLLCLINHWRPSLCSEVFMISIEATGNLGRKSKHLILLCTEIKPILYY